MTPDDVRRAGRSLAGFSAALVEEERALKGFLHARMYDAAPVQAVRRRAQQMLAGLFAAYRDDPHRLPEYWRPAADGLTATLRARLPQFPDGAEQMRLPAAGSPVPA